MIEVPQGATAKIDFPITDPNGDGTAYSPGSVLVDVLDPQGVEVVTDGVPEELATGLFRFEYSTTTETGPGIWRAHLTAAGGYQADLYFEVLQTPSETTSGYGGPRELLRGVGGTISLTVDTPATGPVLVTITNGDGETIVDNEEAILQPGSTATYELPVSGAQAELLDEYSVRWVMVVNGDAKAYATSFEVVGGFFFPLQQLRDLDQELDDLQKYPDSKLIRARERAAEVIESETGLSFRLKGARVSLVGNGERLVLLRGKHGEPLWSPRRLASVSIDDVAFTEDDLVGVRLHAWGALERQAYTYWTSRGVVEIHLEYGMPQVPTRVAAEAAVLALSYVKSSAIPQRATSVSAGDDTFRVTTRDLENEITGIPSVDQLINSLKHDVPAVG